MLDPNDPASTPDELTTRLPSELEDPHQKAVKALAESKRQAFIRARPAIDRQLDADKHAVDKAYEALSQAMNALYHTEMGANRIAPYGLHVVELADEQHREGQEWRGWKQRAWPSKSVARHEKIALLG